MIPEEHIGSVFGDLTVISMHSKVARQVKMLCLCKCGKEKPIRLSSLISGCSTTCGCWRDNRTKTSEYNIWRKVMARCLNPNNDNYHHYGGRGITVCDRWLESFESFLQDMGPRPSHKHSIERVDVNGNYEPSNCIWADSKTQGRNKRNSVFMVHNGEKVNIKTYCEDNNLNYNTVFSRIARARKKSAA